MKNVDWSKEPEIRWEKKICPICHGPTGESGNCHSKEINADVLNSIDDPLETKTIDVNGELFPIFSKQCYYRKKNDYLVFANYPISNALATTLGSVDGIDNIILRSPYRMDVTIADQFEWVQVKNIFNKSYRDFINEHRKNKNKSS